jgi:hypothetical protein
MRPSAHEFIAPLLHSDPAASPARPLVRWYRRRDQGPAHVRLGHRDVSLGQSCVSQPNSTQAHRGDRRCRQCRSSECLTDECRLAICDGHDLPGLIGDPVPGVAAKVDGVIEACEDAVGQPAESGLSDCGSKPTAGRTLTLSEARNLSYICGSTSS